MSMHWAETRAEVDWLTTGTGPLAGWLGSSPLASGLELLRKAGALGPALSLVHGNCAQPKEWRELARTGTPLVHCPGSHIYFGREPFVLREALDAGVRVALGTDSAASNQDLNMGREVALLRAQHPWLVAAEALCDGDECRGLCPGNARSGGALGGRGSSGRSLVPMGFRHPSRFSNGGGRTRISDHRGSFAQNGLGFRQQCFGMKCLPLQAKRSF